MKTANLEQQFQDSNSQFSVSNFLPLAKRQTNKKQTPVTSNPEQKIEELGYQLIEEISIITPLEVHPNTLSAQIQTYYYQRKLPSVMEQELRKRQEKEKTDFIMAITSLFRKSFAKIDNKFTMLLPTGGIIYFFMEKNQHLPKLFIATHNQDFSYSLEKQGIRFKELKKKEYERERIIIDAQHIKLFYGYFLNWIITKNINIEIYSNFLFDFAFRDTPMTIKLIQNRSQYQHLSYKEQSCIGQKKSKLYLIRFQSIWCKQDIQKIQKRLNQQEYRCQRQLKIQNINHEYQFKINKFTVGLDQDQIDQPHLKAEDY